MSDETAFEIWWLKEGYAMVQKHDEDHEDHIKRISHIAWLNGADKARNKETE